jgi:hypothetical protein
VEAGEELQEGLVFRFASLSPTFPSDSPKALAKHFEFSRVEESLIKKGKAVRVSVWDRALTTIAQARALRSVSKEIIAFLLDVAQIREIELNGVRWLKVIRDPLADQMPGADGHCGIAGLSKHECPAKDDRKTLRVRLADLTFRADE